MYHVLVSGITLSLLYLLSFIFYRSGIFSLALHRKIWNIILALTFLFTAIAGILTALQINYKWDIPYIETILKWHVETGVCLGLTGFFHLIWHLSYFRNIFSANERPSGNKTPYYKIYHSLPLNLFIIGFTGTSVQFLLLRETMNISGGYELVSGVFFGSWLIASAAGSVLARRSDMNDLRKINIIFSISPFASLLLFILLSRLFLQTGETPSFLISMILTFLFLIPFCIISAFTFIKLLSHALELKSYTPGRSFSIETTGGIASGLIVSVLAAGSLNTYQLLLTVILLTLAYSILTFYFHRGVYRIICKLFFVIIISFVIISEPDIFFRQLLLPAIQVKETRDTPYGNITTGVYSGEESLYYNQRLFSFPDNTIESEEDIHYAMLQLTNPESVILISGNPVSHIREVLKYPVSKIFFIERDPALADKSISQSFDENVRIIVENDDAYRYIRSEGEKTDALLLLLPPPSTLSLNRFYTSEFFGQVKERLSSGGIFMCSPGPGETYLNQHSINIYSSVFNSLKAHFLHVMPVVGNKLYFLASDRELSLSFCSMTEKTGIENIYVNPDYLADDIIEKRSADILALMDPAIIKNTSLFPIACFYYQSYNFSKDPGEKTPSIIIMIMAFAAPLLIVRQQNRIMYFTASALAGFEIIILLTLQLSVGNMYQFTGIILAALMAGLATGAGINVHKLERISPVMISVIAIIFYLITGLFYGLIIDINNIPAAISLILILTFIPSFLTGHIFHKLTMQVGSEASSASIYSADLAGSALGFILISGLTVPVFGIRNSVFFLAILILAGLLFGTTRNK